MNDHVEQAYIALMAEITTFYYVESETHETIANRLGISRVKAGCWLKRAHTEGRRCASSPALVGGRRD